MRAMTFLDFSRIEETSKNTQERLDQKDKEIMNLIVEVRQLKDDKLRTEERLGQFEIKMKKGMKETLDNAKRLQRMANEGLRSALEERLRKGGILVSNKVDLKKLAEVDPKGETLKTLETTEIIKKYQLV